MLEINLKCKIIHGIMNLTTKEGITVELGVRWPIQSEVSTKLSTIIDHTHTNIDYNNNY